MANRVEGLSLQVGKDYLLVVGQAFWVGIVSLYGLCAEEGDLYGTINKVIFNFEEYEISCFAMF